MNVSLYYSALNNEAEASARLVRVKAELKRALAQQRSFSGTMSPFAMKLGLIGKKNKERLTELGENVSKLESEFGQIEQQIVQIRYELTMFKKNELDAKGDPSLSRGRSVYGFYVQARTRILAFQKAVQGFLVALGEARGAMSANYDMAEGTYSSFAKQRIAEATAKARTVDNVLLDLGNLSKQFKVEAQGTRYAELELPQMQHADYENLVTSLCSKPIAAAYDGFTRLLDACKQLDNRGIDEALAMLDTVEEQHAHLTDDHAVLAWKRDQRALLTKA